MNLTVEAVYDPTLGAAQEAKDSFLLPLNTILLTPDTSTAEKYPFQVDKPSLEEVCTAVQQLRNK